MWVEGTDYEGCTDDNGCNKDDDEVEIYSYNLQETPPAAMKELFSLAWRRNIELKLASKWVGESEREAAKDFYGGEHQIRVASEPIKTALANVARLAPRAF